MAKFVTAHAVLSRVPSFFDWCALFFLLGHCVLLLFSRGRLCCVFAFTIVGQRSAFLLKSFLLKIHIARASA